MFLNVTAKEVKANLRLTRRLKTWGHMNEEDEKLEEHEAELRGLDEHFVNVLSLESTHDHHQKRTSDRHNYHQNRRDGDHQS